MLERARRRRRPSDDSAQSLAEFAMVLPIVILVIFGLVDMARAMQSYVTIQEAARSAARYAVTGRTDCSGVTTQTRENCIVHEVAVRTASLNRHNTITTSYESWTYPGYADPPTTNSAGNPCDAVQIKVGYDYHPMTPVFSTLIGSFHMDASERMLNEPFGPCTG
jgi:Flp pilus assembly protein TadG